MTQHWTPKTGFAQSLPLVPVLLDDEIAGQTAAMLRLKRLVAVVAPSNAAVLVSGPTGAGKDRIVRVLHKLSGRKGALVHVDCAALSDATLESDLFGIGTEAGLIEAAEGGTLYLDNITALSDAAQTRLARALETGALRRVGSARTVAVDFRLVSSTSADMTRLGLRADFVQRIAAFPLSVPALAERAQDLPALVADMLAELSLANPAFDAPRFDALAMQTLAAHDWPGNLRELKNVVLRAFLMFSGQTITARDLRDAMGMTMTEQSTGADVEAITTAQTTCEALPEGGDMDLRSYLRDIEVGLIETALERSNGCVSKAADILRLRRTTLIEKMRKYCIERDLAQVA
jgi:sigma-54 specific flagellar transcriptional regulator A